MDRRGRALADPDDAEAAEEAAIRVLACAAQTEVSLQRRLEQRGWSLEAARDATQRCVRRGLVDDSAVATALTERRLSRGYGRARILADLHARGVAEVPLEAALRGVGMDDERAGATRVADQLWVRELGRRRLDDGRRLERVAAALGRRGFEGQVIREQLVRLGQISPID